MSKKEYKINTPIKGIDIEVGKLSALDLKENDIKALLDCGAISEPESNAVVEPEESDPSGVDIDQEKQGNNETVRPEDDEAAKQQIINAINTLDKNDKTKWTKNKKPDANVLSEQLGWEVSAAVRDDIWNEMSKGSN